MESKLSNLIAVAIIGISAIAVPATGLADTQRGGQSGGGGHAGGGGQSHGKSSGGGGGQSRGSDQQVHAQRETVRTSNYVSKPMQLPAGSSRTQNQGNGSKGQEGRTSRSVLSRPVRNRPGVQQQRTFTKTAQGRVYDNGLHLRKGMPVTASWETHYFPKGHYHFPLYRQNFVRGQCFVSPFGFFFGVCVPFIGAEDCHVYPPAVTFVDSPIYNGDNCTGFADASTQNFLSDPNLDQDEPGLGNALDALTETFQGDDIDGLVSLVDPNTSIAIYFRGHYKYSLPANDYVDLTRDAIGSLHTVQFSLQYLHQRAPGVFSAAGQQTYLDDSGQTQTMWVSYVLQDISGQWTLTQVETSPGDYHHLVQ
jgi:hypothetical protein